ncbi:LOW QUALITY PROTEIN: cyclopentanone 1,2-monooxygenase [Bipolaris maydis]|nr:LOW QUALITY PROTEIN: cyclopentanone 1,2-monooxygenase [Bipolaris maydis]
MDSSKITHDAPSKEYHSLIIGAGFGGLKMLRDASYSVKLVEYRSNYRGIYGIPQYEFSDPALWKESIWKQRFSASKYFQHVAKVWDLRKDTEFNSFVSSTVWSENDAKWTVKLNTGETYKVKFLLLNTGFAAKQYVPNWKRIEVDVVGTGSTGIQLAQELSKVTGHPIVFQRTLNMSLPMGQVNYEPPPKQAIPKPDYPKLFDEQPVSFSGFSFNFLLRSTFDDTPERLRIYEKLWKQRDFKFWLATNSDMLFTQEANRETKGKINESKVADILAPIEQPSAFGCKRISLENKYFEMPNVSLVDISDKGTPIQEITENGIKTIDSDATGCDAIAGGLKQIEIRGSSVESLSEHWKEGTKTYLVAGFPNMFFTYVLQAPTALCNGPTCAEIQGNWILQIQAQERSGDEWKELIWKLANASLLASVDPWYMGTNIPGKTREPLIYLGVVPNSYKIIHETATSGYIGFDFS